MVHFCWDASLWRSDWLLLCCFPQAFPWFELWCTTLFIFSIVLLHFYFYMWFCKEGFVLCFAMWATRGCFELQWHINKFNNSICIVFWECSPQHLEVTELPIPVLCRDEEFSGCIELKLCLCLLAMLPGTIGNSHAITIGYSWVSVLHHTATWSAEILVSFVERVERIWVRVLYWANTVSSRS